MRDEEVKKRLTENTELCYAIVNPVARGKIVILPGRDYENPAKPFMQPHEGVACFLGFAGFFVLLKGGF